MTWLSETDQGVILQLRVIPNAKKNMIQGIHDAALKIRIAAPPVEGKANKALRKFLAQSFGLSVSRIEILAGDTGRCKKVLLAGLTSEAIHQVLS